MKHYGIDLAPFCPFQSQSPENGGPSLWYLIPKFLQNSGREWLNEIIISKCCEHRCFKNKHNPAFMSCSPIFSFIFSHCEMRCYRYFKVHKHCAVVGKKVEIKILAPEFCSFMILVSYFTTLIVNLLKYKMGKIILYIIVVKINIAFNLVPGTKWMIRFSF